LRFCEFTRPNDQWNRERESEIEGSGSRSEQKQKQEQAKSFKKKEKGRCIKNANCKKILTELLTTKPHTHTYGTSKYNKL
jgi:hypothetical protein